MKEIKLTQNKYAIVDDEDFEKLSEYKWYYSHGYAKRDSKINGKKTRIYMHRLIMKDPSGFMIDHIDGNKLNNTKLNLRKCNNMENVRSQRKNIIRGKTSIYKGVYFDKNRKLFSSSITVNRKVINLGRFTNEIDAAKEYNKAALKYFGEFAVLNVMG